MRDADYVYHTPKSKKWARLWVCENYPECDSYVSCHPRTNAAKGTLANRYLRGLRLDAHKSFDSIWKSGYMDRHAAYRWLSREMSMSLDECHIALFNEEQCRRVIRLCDSVRDPAVVRYRQYVQSQGY